MNYPWLNLISFFKKLILNPISNFAISVLTGRNKRYTFVDQYRTWENASAHCESLEMQLPSVNSQQDYDLIMDELKIM